MRLGARALAGGPRGSRVVIVVARASSVMTSGVITVPPHAPLERARVLLVGNRFSALPVVDGQDRLVGIVTTLDLLRAEVEGRAGARVGEVMTRDPMTAAPETALTIIAHRLRHYGGKRVMPIVDRGFLVGIVTRGDLLRPPDERSFLRRILGSGSADDDFDEPPDSPRIGTTAGEVMTPLADVYYAEPTSTLEYAATTLSRYRLTALPVLDEENRLLGVVSEADLVPDRLSGRRGPYTVRRGRHDGRRVRRHAHLPGRQGGPGDDQGSPPRAAGARRRPARDRDDQPRRPAPGGLAAGSEGRGDVAGSAVVEAPRHPCPSDTDAAVHLRATL